MCEVNILVTGCFGIRRGLFPVSIFSSACGNQEIRVAEQIKERKLREETEQKRKREARARKEWLERNPCIFPLAMATSGSYSL